MTSQPVYQSLWLADTAKQVRTGYRAYLTLREGRKFVWLLCTEDASQLMVSLAEYRQAQLKARELPLMRSRLRTRLRAVARTYGNADSRALKYALSLLAPHSKDQAL